MTVVHLPHVTVR